MDAGLRVRRRSHGLLQAYAIKSEKADRPLEDSEPVPFSDRPYGSAPLTIGAAPTQEKHGFALVGDVGPMKCRKYGAVREGLAKKDNAP
jgi:hypothetical protein